MNSLNKLGQELLEHEYGKDTDREAKHVGWDAYHGLEVSGSFGTNIDNYSLDTIIEHLYDRITHLEKQLEEK